MTSPGLATCSASAWVPLEVIARSPPASIRDGHYPGARKLGRGTIVRYNGIEVGNVTELGFDPVDPSRGVVTLQTAPTLRLHEDAIASIDQQGLTGAVFG